MMRLPEFDGLDGGHGTFEEFGHFLSGQADQRVEHGQGMSLRRRKRVPEEVVLVADNTCPTT
jgi:hypothetical protein